MKKLVLLTVLVLLLTVAGFCCGCRTTRSTLEAEAVYYPEREETTAISVVVKFEDFRPVAPLYCD